MTNGDRVRTFSNEQLALILMCPNEACFDDIECRKTEENNHCIRCVYDWLNAEESDLDEEQDGE